MKSLFAIFIFTVLLCGCKPSSSTQAPPTNLKPVAGAFGLKLGEKIPEGFEFDDSALKKKMEPFIHFNADTTEDGRICCLSAIGATEYESDASDCKKRLISVLTEKYGLRQQNPKDYRNVEEYDFGTDDRSAHLKIIEGKSFYLDFYDKNLRHIYFDEQDSKKAKEDADKKAALSKGL